MRFPVVQHDPVRLSIYIVGAVFLVAVFGVLVSSWPDRANLEFVDLISDAGDAFGMLGFSFIAQSIPAFVGCAMAWKCGRTRARWTTVDYVLPVVPWACWALLSMLIPGDKSGTSFFIEGMLVGVAAPLGAVVRLTSARTLSLGWSQATSYGAALLVAIGLWALLPGLPE